MNKWILTAVLCLLTLPAAKAQRLLIGEKIPDVRLSDWYGGRIPSDTKKAALIYFFHSSNKQCVSDLSELGSLANTYASRLNVIVITKENFDKIALYLSDAAGYYTAFDEGGKAFSAYSVRFVPFCVVADGRGRLVWTGNLSNLTPDILQKSF